MSGGARRAAEARLVRRLGEAVELLAPAGIIVAPLDAAATTAVLAAACNPDPLLPPNPRWAGAGEVVHAAPGPTYWEGDEPADQDDEPGHDTDPEYDGWDDEPSAPGDDGWNDDQGWDDQDRDDQDLSDEDWDDDQDDLAWDGRADGAPDPQARAARARRAVPEPTTFGRDRSRRRETPGARGARR